MSSTQSTPYSPATPPPEGMLIPTMNMEGKRRWLSPQLVKGMWWKRRGLVACALIAIYAITPFLSWSGLPLVQFDIEGRRLVFFGTVLRPTETLLLALLTLIVFVSIFTLTALLGRVWCGWACPQTIYLEFVYRPLQKVFLGEHKPGSRAKPAAWRMLALAATYVIISAHLSNTFIAWFVGAKPLAHWMFVPPNQHPVAFTTFVLMTAAMLFLFGYFREQLCSIVCPYGRLQSVLLDKRSLIIGYDQQRGEPRGKKGTTTGQCVDCSLCVRACPTGIDIRKGLQMECVSCTQCIDACDKVMTTLHLPVGLIRYGSQASFETGRKGKWLRTRVVIYPTLLVALIAAFSIVVARRTPLALTQLRMQSERFVTEPSGDIRTPVRVRIDNRTSTDRHVTVTADASAAITGANTIVVGAFDCAETEFSLLSTPQEFTRGRRTLELRVSDDEGSVIDAFVTVLGPMTLPPLKSGSPAQPVGESRTP